MPNSKLTFKQVDPTQHAKLLYEMDISTFTRGFDYPAESAASTLEYLKDSQVYLAYVGDALIGTFSFNESEDEVEVRQLLVLPQYQHRGYGRIMMGRLMELNSGKPIWLVTHPSNRGALLLYIHAGFIIFGYKENYYGDGQPRVLLRYTGE